MTDSTKKHGPVSTVVRGFLSALLTELLVIRGIFKDIFNFREETLTVTEQNEKDKEAITALKEYVYWEPGLPPSVTLDGTFYLEDLKTIIRFMENDGPGLGGCNHKEL